MATESPVFRFTRFPTVPPPSRNPTLTSEAPTISNRRLKLQ
jgi:hypothetical protein